MTLPTYLLEVLVTHMGALEAMEERTAISAAAAPHTKPMSYRSHLRALDRRIRQMEVYVPAPPLAASGVHDPEKAREWFQAMGVQIASKTESEPTETASSG